MRELVAKLKQQNLGLQELQRQEQSWAEQPTSSHMAAMPVGALSKEVRAGERGALEESMVQGRWNREKGGWSQK
jgi:hypothetical protein